MTSPFIPNSFTYGDAPGGGVVMPTIIAERDPGNNDKLDIGYNWVNKTAQTSWQLVGYTSGIPNWVSGGNAEATTTSMGIVELATLAELQGGSAPAGAYVPTANDVATVIAGVVVGAVPPATATQQGIVELATDAQVVTPFTTDVPNTAVQPSNLTALFAASPPIGATTPNTAVFSDLTATGTISIASAAPIVIDVTGAGNDLTLSSDAGRVIVNGEEAADNAITLLSAAGGIDANAALQINLATSETDADSFVITSGGGFDLTATGAAGKDIDIVSTSGSINLTAGEAIATSMVFTNTGMDIATTGAAGRDIDITNTGGSINITATENQAGAIIIQANGGTSERVTLLASQGTAADSINLESTAGGITLSAALATADAINLAASAGGVDINGALQVNIASSQNAVDAIRIEASAGGIDIDAVGAATEDINITNTGGSILLVATEAVADAIVLSATTALGGIDVNAGTGGMTVDSGGVLSLDSNGATNLTATGAFDITVQSTLGSILLNAGEAAADAINIDSTGGFDLDAALQINIASSQAAAANSVRIVASAVDGGIDVDAGTGGITIDSTGAVAINGAVASTFAVSGAGVDLTFDAAAGRVIIDGGEAANNAITLDASDAAGGIDVNAGSGGFIVDAVAGAISLDAALASNLTVTGAADLTIQSTAGAVNIISGEANLDSLNMTSAGGFSLVATGAAAKDVIITSTSGSMTLSAGESVTDAMNFTAGGVASGINLSAGTNGILLSSGLKLKVTEVVTGVDASPYALLGTDTFVSVDTGAGIMTITLPAAPATGRMVTVYDGGGAAAGSNITIDGNGKNIAAAGTAAATKLINTAYESYNLVYNGTLWLGQNVV